MSDKVSKIRELLLEYKIDAYIIPSTDEFLSEYVPSDAQRLKYISNFTGSNGHLIISTKKAAFFTDGRYIEQAAKEINTELIDIFLYNQKKPSDWVLENNIRDLGYDPFTHTKKELELFSCKLKPVTNLVDLIWQDKPKKQYSNIFDHPKRYSGEDRNSKISTIITKIKADYLLLTKPESICWLLNIRGNDVDFNPFILGYALVNKKGEVYLFTKNQLDMKLPIPGVYYLSLNQIEDFLNKIMPCTIQADPSSSPVWFFNKISNIVSQEDPCILPRACKNRIEQLGAKKAHIKDAIAMIRFLYWLEKHNLDNITEYDLAEKLSSFRLSEKTCVSPSFSSIVGFAENSSIIHYSPKNKEAKYISNKNILLIDSGGQYLEGTTDITRTIHLGKPKRQHITDYTLVLKGHIALASAIFPKNTVGWQLDVLARQYLWAAQKDYHHGTSHGVGSFLSVHEGPQSISRYGNTAILREGMLLSNEPGYYIAGQYGIRLENILLVKNFSSEYLCFETLTLVPFQKKLIDRKMLIQKEIDWINSYHNAILNKIMPLIDDPKIERWLKIQSMPL